jgi:hypothetical protein
MNSRLVIRALTIAVTGLLLARPQPAPAATIGLSVTQSSTKLITGGVVQVNASVTDTDLNDPDGMDYTVTYSDWHGSITTPPLNTAESSLASQFTFNSAYGANLAPLGNDPYTISVSSNQATNSPATYNGSVLVLAHSFPQIFSYVLNKFIPIPSAAQEPPVDPLAFGATGGGDTAAVVSGAVSNRDPPEPTAGMALNFISEVGDSKITSNLATFDYLAPIAPDNQNPNDGYVFQVQCVNTSPGTFSKTFTLGFSDEQDLPGANSPGSFVAKVSYTFHINPDGSSTYEVYLVPEPASLALLAIGLPVAAGMMRLDQKRIKKGVRTAV